MIINNAKTTILLTSIMIAGILLIPNSAFGEVPEGCDAGTGTISGALSVDPFFKGNDEEEVFLTYTIKNLQDDDVKAACDGLITSASLEVNNGQVDGTAGCPIDNGEFPIAISNDDEIELWGDSGLFGTCEISAFLQFGSNDIEAFGNVEQFNAEDDETTNSQNAGNTVSKTVFDRCISVDKTGPPKVRLIDGFAEVTFEVTVTNCADEETGSALDNCRFEDTIAGNDDVDLGVIEPGDDAGFEYEDEIDGDTENSVEVFCDDQQGEEISDTDTHMITTYFAEIEVTKMAPEKLGTDDEVTWTVWIENLGSSAIDNCVINDQILGIEDDDTSCASTIEPGDFCHVEYPGVSCNESVENNVSVTCEDQEDVEVPGEASADPPFCADFSVDIQKECDIKVVVVPDNESDPINCKITVENDGPSTLTNCVVTDSLGGTFPTGDDPGAGKFPSMLDVDQIVEVDTETFVTPEMVAEMTVVNFAEITCETQEEFPPVTDDTEEEILIREVSATVVKMCEPESQDAPGTITWEWWVTNTSPDGKSTLDFSCEGSSTLNESEPQDFRDGVLTFGSSTHNEWIEEELESGIYDNEIVCTFTAQDNRSFEISADASCEVKGESRGCTPGFWKNNADKRDACQWVVEDPGDSLTDHFDVSIPLQGDTLIDALKYHGGNCEKGGTERQMLRMAVAAKLNIEADIGYEIDTVDALEILVNGALNADPDDRCAAMKTVHNQLGEFNEGPDDFELENDGESFCPLSNSREANQCEA